MESRLFTTTATLQRTSFICRHQLPFSPYNILIRIDIRTSHTSPHRTDTQSAETPLSREHLIRLHPSAIHSPSYIHYERPPLIAPAGPLGQRPYQSSNLLDIARSSHHTIPTTPAHHPRVKMSDRQTVHPKATMPTVGHELSEENLAAIDEPPDTLRASFCWSPPKLSAPFVRSPAPQGPRRESLLTRQLHSETEPTDNDEPKSPARALSTQSTWSSISMPSPAELTSDDGHSMPSIAGSPPPPPTRTPTAIHVAHQKPLEHAVHIVGQDVPAADTNKGTAEANVEANLGRKRCISFACRGKQEVVKPAAEPEPAQTPAASPPKRKCMLKFVCPSKVETDAKTADKSPAKKRPTSPPPMARRSSPAIKHRGSDSTVSHVSPKATRRIPEAETKPQEKTTTPASNKARRYSNESENDTSGDERTRFHEFATSDEEPEAWTQMSTCHRNRLTVDDTLKKENVIRKTCTEVEEEVMEEEEEEEEEDLDDELAAVAGMEEDAVDDGDDTDEGFHSDDEGGFASSDSDSDSSDFEWWKPSGLSTAATSVDQLDRLAIVNAQAGGSAGSASSSPTSPRTPRLMMRKAPSRQPSTPAMSIKKPAAPEPDLPDTSDFVCGTLDEDRSIEEEFITRRNQKIAAKRPVRPQDIDPTFPTSDPEMDEEDDDDVDPPQPTGDESDMFHGQLDEIHEAGTVRRRSPAPLRRARTRSNAARSPPPPARHQSPAPTKQRPTRRSPAPAPRRSIARSPAPPRNLFAHSPDRTKSPARTKRMTSPPNSPMDRSERQANAVRGLGGRPQPTHTSSLPRGGAPIALSKLATIPSDDDSTTDQHNMEIPKRGAIDIVKGLEKKRAWRKKKLAQKMCAKAANKCDKAYKVKPGTGAERMREVGLQLQGHYGKAEHILSL